MIGNKITKKSQKFQKIYKKIIQRQLPMIKADKEITKEMCISPKKRQKNIDNLRLI